VKVILETSRLTRDEKVAACALAQAAGAAWVKTSTGYAGGGASVDDVALLRASVGHAVGVKASGGIRTADDALRMVRAGADRIGTSSGPGIVEGAFAGQG
jgi:deoxyribose-phosphate aldolase